MKSITPMGGVLIIARVRTCVCLWKLWIAVARKTRCAQARRAGTWQLPDTLAWTMQEAAKTWFPGFLTYSEALIVLIAVWRWYKQGTNGLQNSRIWKMWQILTALFHIANFTSTDILTLKCQMIIRNSEKFGKKLELLAEGNRLFSFHYLVLICYDTNRIEKAEVNISYIFACIFVAAGMCLLTRCLATGLWGQKVIQMVRRSRKCHHVYFKMRKEDWRLERLHNEYLHGFCASWKSRS
jgi:hypothetical protein